MDSLPFKLDYMGRLFRKISHKPTEAYIIQRIWHRLDDDRVKFVLQQHVSLGNENRALIDLYLPQIDMAVEINEPYHLDDNQEMRDTIRNNEVERIAGCQVEVIDCSQSLENVHKRVEEVVTLIREKIQERGVGLIPWTGDDEMLPEHYEKINYLKVEDSNYFHSVDDICKVFGTVAIHRGYLRAGVADIPDVDDAILWFPSVFAREWENNLNDDGILITERNKVSPEKTKAHYDSIMKEYDDGKLSKRITFFKKRDELGFNFYKFVGVFELDVQLSRDNGIVCWKRTSDRVRIH